MAVISRLCDQGNETRSSRREARVGGIDADLLPAEEKKEWPEYVWDERRRNEDCQIRARRELLAGKADREVADEHTAKSSVETKDDTSAQGEGAQVAGVGVEIAVGHFDDAPVEAGDKLLVDAADATKVELGGARGVVPVGEMAGAEKKFGVGGEIAMRMECDPGPQEGAEKVGLAGGAGVLKADVTPDFAEGNLDEIGVEAEAAAGTPLIRGGEIIEVGAAEQTIDARFVPGLPGRRVPRGAVRKERSEGGDDGSQNYSFRRKPLHKRVACPGDSATRVGMTACWQ